MTDTAKPSGFQRHPDEPPYTDRELALAESDAHDTKLTGDPARERAVVRRGDVEGDRADGLVADPDPVVTEAREQAERDTVTGVHDQKGK